MNRRCIDVLHSEHKIMLRIAEVLDSMVKKVEEYSDYNVEDGETVFNLLRHFGDGLHQAKEEGALFPAFLSRCDASEYAAVRHMTFEHEQDRSLMSGIADAISRSNAADFVTYATRLVSILQTHIFKEDNVLFQMIANRISPDDDQRIMDEFGSFDKDFNEQHPELLNALRRLEWKYLRKIA